MKLCTFGVFALGASLISCIGMCVMNKQFELFEFVFYYVYVVLQYDLIFTAGSVSLCDVCSRPWSVCEVAVVPYVDVVTVMSVLLFVLHVCMLRECEGNGNIGVEGGGVVMVSAGHVDGTRGSGILSSAANILGMSVVCGMRGVENVYVFGSGRVYEERGGGDLPILWTYVCVCVAVV